MITRRTFRKVDFYYCGEYHSSIEICMEEYTRIKSDRPNFEPWDFAHSKVWPDETTTGLYTWKFNSFFEPIIIEPKIERNY